MGPELLPPLPGSWLASNLTSCHHFLSKLSLSASQASKGAHKGLKCHFMALTDTQAAQAPAGNIRTQITLKICFPIFAPLRGLNGGQMSGI